MSAHPPHEQRDISHLQFRDYNFINQGNVQGNIYYNAPHPSTRAEVVHAIPYPRNEDLVSRPDLIDKLDRLLPQTSGSSSAALWGLGGSGKTQIALDYAYRRCDTDEKCCVFWVHADSEATFLADYRIIGKKLGVDERLDGPDLLDAVCNEIEARPKWLMIVDNMDNLSIFGVGQQLDREPTKENLCKYVPHASQGTVLWTSRDAHIAGTLVGPRRGIEVRAMDMDEAVLLLSIARDESPNLKETGVDALLQELQHLPLAISQAGAYMKRMSMTAEQYLSLLRQGKTRWELLKVSDTDRHRRPEVSNSVLETWRISVDRIRKESEMSYWILHVVAYVDSQDIPQELLIVAASLSDIADGDVDNGDNKDGHLTRQAPELEVLEAIARLQEFSFLSLRETDSSDRRYEMHKLVQEAVRYRLSARGSAVTIIGNESGADDSLKENEAYYSSRALQVVEVLFPSPERALWAQCEQYIIHAIRIGEWAEVSGTELKTVALLGRVSSFLYDRGRWREREPVDSRAVGLLRRVLGEKHPVIIGAMAALATNYCEQGQYSKAESGYKEILELRQEVLGERHPDTIGGIADLATIYHQQGRYKEVEVLRDRVLELRREVLGEKHPHTLRSMADLALTYHVQGHYGKAEDIYREVLGLRREVLGEKHPETMSNMANLVSLYYVQGRHREVERLRDKVLKLRQEVLGEKHPDTIRSLSYIGASYYIQGKYDEAEEIATKTFELRRRVLGEKHPETIRSMKELTAIYIAQGKCDEAHELAIKVLELRQKVLGEHPDTAGAMAILATTYCSLGRYDKAEQLYRTALDLRRQLLGEDHPETIRSMQWLADTQESLQKQSETNEDRTSRRRSLWEVIHKKTGSLRLSRM